MSLLKTPPSAIFFGPQLLPGGKALLFTQADASGSSERWDAGKIMVQPLGGGAPTVIVDGGTDGRYVSSGHIVFARSGLVHAVAFDVATMTTTSKEVPVIEGVMRGTGTFGSGTIHLDVSDNGVLAYVPGPLVPLATKVQIAMFDFAGNKEALPPVAGPYQSPRISPDGKRVAFVIDAGHEADVWIYDIGTERAPRRLTFGGNNRSPAWSSDSRRVAFRSDREGAMAIYWQTADGTSPAERLTPVTKGTVDWPDAFSPDGRLLLFDRVTLGRTVLWQLSLTDRKESPVGTIASSLLTAAAFSPDGKWIAYAASRARTEERAVRRAVPADRRPLPGLGAQRRRAPSGVVDGRQRSFLHAGSGHPDDARAGDAGRGVRLGIPHDAQPAVRQQCRQRGSACTTWRRTASTSSA